ncbi:hypothetical protein B1748_17520 [Paenibacillus sp. MY03]|jgi:hypothetical protein|uniref:hypothetical protein n=1 Tax=Paenibacillus TaxID=44249 RepID=UPI000B3C1C51|nr:MULTISPECIES: hypothetical protein [Paenibacillus]OUS75290.1 hypothetical protein B1748_17520 [Paenibacillus sp. MY03]QNK55174.1 hypothetical protein H7F31_21420 [Paenibacillus sp. PAMC21692]
MKLIMNQHFQNETIAFDGFSFSNCTFSNCVILITTLDFHFECCSFFGSTLHVNPELPIFDVSHRLSQSDYDSETRCYRDDYKYPRTKVALPSATTSSV